MIEEHSFSAIIKVKNDKIIFKVLRIKKQEEIF